MALNRRTLLGLRSIHRPADFFAARPHAGLAHSTGQAGRHVCAGRRQ